MSIDRVREESEITESVSPSEASPVPRTDDDEELDLKGLLPASEQEGERALY